MAKDTNSNDQKIMFGTKMMAPAYAVLLPSRKFVLCKAGANRGLRTIIPRKEADKKGIQYLKPVRWEKTDYFLYPDFSIRNGKGSYLGKYLGSTWDNYEAEIVSKSYFIGIMREIFIWSKDEKLLAVNREGEVLETTELHMALSRRFTMEEWIKKGLPNLNEKEQRMAERMVLGYISKT